MTRFTKPALTIGQQIGQWRERGLDIPDQQRTEHYLAVISYYRLSAYSLPFQHGDPDHAFKPGVAFDDLLDLYVFDRELRLLLLDAIERIEVAVRANMTNVLALHHGAHAYLNPHIFDTRYNHAWLLEQVRRKCEEANAEAFIAHYRNKYEDPRLPPVWMVMEILTFKEVSTLFANLRRRDDKQAIASFWGLPDTVLRSWFRALSDLRNVCAHHARTWNREFGSRPLIPRRQPERWPDLSARLADPHIEPTRRLYYLLVVMETLLNVANPESTWRWRLKGLLDRFPAVSRAHMGMPNDWDSDPFWDLAGDPPEEHS